MDFWRAYDQLAESVDRRFRWHRLPRVLGLATLAGIRNTLRRENLYDTGPAAGAPSAPPAPPTPEQLTSRTTDGTYNDLANPRMGMAGSRFGRNVPLAEAHPEPSPAILGPSPREISRSLLTRTGLIPATSVNALVAPWLQFMIRDWFSHGRHTGENPWEIRLADDDPWPERPMRIPRTPPDGPGSPPAYVNTLTHWWDASQIYGTSREYQDFIRTGERGRLRVDADGNPPAPTGDLDPAREPGFWLGLAMLGSLFTREHNSICDMLAGHYPSWSDEELFQRARLILAALIAKIHTVEWTPAVINHPTTVTAMNANWWGLAGERISRVAGRISSSEVISGIVGGPTQHHGVPYSLTEEFVAVYRMHPLMPDDFDFRSLTDDRGHGSWTLRDLSGPGALDVLTKVGNADLLYSFGTSHPGLVTLHNFPRHLQDFVRPDGRRMDLAATDIMRDREFGVPRYNQFRRLLHLPAPATFEELTDNPEWAREIAGVYQGDIERVDLMVGLFAEPRPAGFAFSDTAFRVFVVMASRRLNSDRFLTRDFTPAVYTPEGLRWVADNTMLSVLLRHHPELRPAMRDAANAFKPWQRAGR